MMSRGFTHVVRAISLNATYNILIHLTMVFCTSLPMRTMYMPGLCTGMMRSLPW